MKTISRKTYIKYLDALWSACIHIRDNGICQYSKLVQHKIKKGAEAHHIFSRTSLNTRWNLKNGILLRAMHNYSKAHISPEDFRQFLITKWFKSESEYKNLHIASCLIWKQDLALWELYLLKELGKLIDKDLLNKWHGMSISAKIKELKKNIEK